MRNDRGNRARQRTNGSDNRDKLTLRHIRTATHRLTLLKFEEPSAPNYELRKAIDGMYFLAGLQQTEKRGDMMAREISLKSQGLVVDGE